MRPWCIYVLSVSLPLVSPSISVAASSDVIDWDAVTERTIAILGEMVPIDTANPPGNELPVARYVAEKLAAAGIDVDVLDSAPGRGNVVARYRGDGSEEPLLLLAHMDVVGVEREHWDTDPFSMTEKDGYLYGRGVMDDKGMLAGMLAVMLLLAERDEKLSRDVILMGNADEEAGGRHGVDHVASNHFDKIKAAFALNEGGGIRKAGPEITYFGIQSTEKISTNIRLVAHGTSGHGSMPRPDNPVFALSRALARISEYETPVRLIPTTRSFFEGMSGIASGDMQWGMRNLENDDPAIASRASRTVSQNIMYNSMLRDSISATLLDAGIRSNVIPSIAEATLNCRLLPGTKIKDFVDELYRVIHEPSVEIIYPEHATDSAPPPSPPTTALYQSLKTVAARHAPDAIIVPVMSTGATDSAELRRKGIPTYGLMPYPVPEEDTGLMHGNNERIAVSSIRFGVEYLWDVVIETCR